MILTDSNIVQFRKQGQLDIIPWNDKQLGTNSYDLTLNNQLKIYRLDTRNVGECLDMKRNNPTYSTVIPEEGYILQPGVLYLGCTNEITVSRTVVPQIEGKSSIGRLGISVHVTAGFGDIGFKGSFTLEITVVYPVRVYPNVPIAQIYFFLPLGTPTIPYNLKQGAKYKDQPVEPVPSMMWKNFQTVPETNNY